MNARLIEKEADCFIEDTKATWKKKGTDWTLKIIITRILFQTSREEK